MLGSSNRFFRAVQAAHLSRANWRISLTTALVGSPDRFLPSNGVIQCAEDLLRCNRPEKPESFGPSCDVGFAGHPPHILLVVRKEIPQARLLITEWVVQSVNQGPHDGLHQIDVGCQISVGFAQVSLVVLDGLNGITKFVGNHNTFPRRWVSSRKYRTSCPSSS